MATFPITKLPPGPAPREEAKYIQPRHPVSAEFGADGEVSSTGLDYGDYGRMSTQLRKQSGERRTPTPPWALDDKLLQLAIVNYLEYRGNLKAGAGAMAERLARAEARLKLARAYQEATLTRLCKKYAALRKEEVPDEHLRKLAAQIEAVDSTLRFGENGWAGLLARVVYLYHRLKLDSVGVAQETGLKPPHIRQLLFRLNATWKQMQNGKGPRPHLLRGDIDVSRAAKLQDEGKSFVAIAQAFGCGASDGTVRKALVDAGLYKPRKHQHGAAARVAELLSQGKTQADVSRELGVSEAAVSMCLRNAGLRRNLFVSDGAFKRALWLAAGKCGTCGKEPRATGRDGDRLLAECKSCRAHYNELSKAWYRLKRRS